MHDYKNLKDAIKDLEANTFRAKALTLGPLSTEDLNRMLNDTLHAFNELEEESLMFKCLSESLESALAEVENDLHIAEGKVNFLEGECVALQEGLNFEGNRP